MARQVQGLEEEVLVYENPAIRSARMSTAFALATMALSVVLAVYVFYTLPAAGEPAELAPLGQRVAWAGGVIMMGAIFFGMMCRYVCYITSRLLYRPRTDELVVESLTVFRRKQRVVELDEVATSNLSEIDPLGLEEPDEVPWIKIMLRSGSSFVVSLPGRIHRYDVFNRMLRQAGFDFDWVSRHQAAFERV